MVRGIAAKTEWWKGRDSNPRPRHYELAAPLKIGFNFNNLSAGRPLRLARLSTTEHDRFPQDSRKTMRCEYSQTHHRHAVLSTPIFIPTYISPPPSRSREPIKSARHQTLAVRPRGSTMTMMAMGNTRTTYNQVVLLLPE